MSIPTPTIIRYKPIGNEVHVVISVVTAQGMTSDYHVYRVGGHLGRTTLEYSSHGWPREGATTEWIKGTLKAEERLSEQKTTYWVTKYGGYTDVRPIPEHMDDFEEVQLPATWTEAQLDQWADDYAERAASVDEGI